MQRALSVLDRSVTVKLALIGFLVLILLIPVLFIKGVVYDRAQLADEARREIAHAWGEEQILAGPVVLIPWRQTMAIEDGKARQVRGVLAHLPQRAETHLSVDTQTRYRGLYQVPVYSAKARLVADFAAPDLSALGLAPEHLELDRARLALPLSDLRTLRSAPVVEVNGRTVTLAASPFHDALDIGLIDAPMAALNLNVLNQRFTVQTELSFAGSNRLSVVPTGDNHHVSMQANWPDPSFTGRYLPRERSVSSEGFVATWDVTSLGRGFAASERHSNRLANPMRAATLGVTLKSGLTTYDKATRALRYAILAITLTFAAFFLFDILSALGLHAVQYLLVGFANCLFFLLLISLAEHIGFSGAYALSAAASVLLIGGYSSAVLHARRRAAACALALAATYGFIYMTLGAQTYALLAGSLGLWTVLALAMYLTRHVDWRSTMGSRLAEGSASADGLTPRQGV